jgi:hypothetical protein
MTQAGSVMRGGQPCSPAPRSARSSPSTRSSRTVVGLLALALAIGAAACNRSASTPATDDPAPANPRDTGPPLPNAGPDEQYVFSRIVMTGGGWMTGLVLHPTDPVRYTRSDVGGAYRWDDGAWVQMLDATTVPEDDQDPSVYYVESLAVAPSDGQVVYLGVGNDAPEAIANDDDAAGRILRSDDGGRSWTASAMRFPIAGNGDHRQQTNRIAVDPVDAEVVVVGTRTGAIWRSEDGGETFVLSATPPTPDGSWDREPPGVTFVVADAAPPTGARATVWYAAIGGGGILRSDDGAATWEVVEQIGSDEVLLDGQVVDGVLYAARRGPEVDGGLVRYDGEAVERFGPPRGSPWWALAVDPRDARRMIAVAEVVGPGRVFLSEDGGRSWSEPAISTRAPDARWIERVNDGSSMYIGQFAFDPLGDRNVWLADGTGVWESPFDAGRLDFEFRGDGIENLVMADMLAPPGSAGLVTAVADAQGFHHLDMAAAPDEPLVDADFAGGVDLDYSGSDPDAMVWIGAEYHLSEQYRGARGARSLDGGATWRELPGLRPEMFGGNVAVAADDPDNIVWIPSQEAATDTDDASPVFVTKNGGRNWQTVTTDEGTGGLHRLVWWLSRQALTSDKVEPATFYLLTDRGEFSVSVDGGSTWDPAAHGPPCTREVTCHVFGAVRADPLRGGVVWAGAGSAGLFRTETAGASPWTRIAAVDEIRAFGFGAPVPGSEEPALYLHGRVGGDERLGIWRSTDDGESFELISHSPGGVFATVTVVNGDMRIPGRVYVGFSGVSAIVGDDPDLAPATAGAGRDSDE